MKWIDSNYNSLTCACRMADVLLCNLENVSLGQLDVGPSTQLKNTFSSEMELIRSIVIGWQT